MSKCCANSGARNMDKARMVGDHVSSNIFLSLNQSSQSFEIYNLRTNCGLFLYCSGALLLHVSCGLSCEADSAGNQSIESTTANSRLLHAICIDPCLPCGWHRLATLIDPEGSKHCEISLGQPGRGADCSVTGERGSLRAAGTDFFDCTVNASKLSTP